MAKMIKINTPRFRRLKNDVILKRIAEISQELNIKVYLVGGAVRDLFMRKTSAKQIDWDFAVDRGAFKLGKMLAKDLNASYIVLDRINKTARVVYNKNKHHYEFDFVDLRAGTLKADLKSRDFTINTLCFDLQNLSSNKKNKDFLLDHFKAVADIKKRCLRITAAGNFKDDPLRILRGFAFCAQFNFKFELKTLRLIKKDVFGLKDISAERICDELVKIFTVRRSYRYFEQMDRFRLLDIIFPEISSLRDVEQGLYHHLDVWQHSLQTLAELEKLLKNLAQKIPKKYAAKINAYLNKEVAYKRPRLWLLKLACILHDIGKSLTRFEGEDGKVHFYTHERVGAEMVVAIARRLKMSIKEISILKNILLYHLRPGQLVNRRPSQRAKFRFFRDAKENAVLILLLTVADRAAMRGVLSREESFTFLEDEIFGMMIEFFKNIEKDTKLFRLLNGTELMNFLQISSGPLVGKILKEIDEAQAIKSINSKMQAKKLAIQVYEKQ